MIMGTDPEETAVVCIIDDDSDVRDGLSSLIRSVGLQVELFGSAEEFLRTEPPSAPCCVILDVRLPGLSGLDFQAQFAKRKSGLPIIFITGYGDIPMSVKAIKAGAVEFLTKPFREQDLLDAVRIAIERDRERRQSEGAVSDLRARFEALTAREREVVALVVMGRLNKQTAAEIGISEITVKVHRHNAMQKMGAKSLVDLVRMADVLEIRPAMRPVD
jgi:FixJ family two-component response regulator